MEMIIIAGDMLTIVEQQIFVIISMGSQPGSSAECS